MDRAEAGLNGANQVRRLAVVGVGLMGGSFALAAKRAGVERVVGFDLEAEALNAARELGVIDEAAASPVEAATGADVVLLSTPVRAIPKLAELVSTADPAPHVVTDIGSTKTSIIAGLSDRAGERFVGGHPMCGAETSGVRFARADLYEGASYFLTPSARVRPMVYESLHGLVAAIGARPVRIEPEAHDQIMARVSHVPHVLANVLMNQVGSYSAGGRRALHSVGPSFKDLTRVAGANPRMWRDIFLENREALISSLEAVREELDEFCRQLRQEDLEGVVENIGEARSYRRQLLELEDLEPENLFRVVARIPDQPGVLGEVTGALAEASINVEDLTLHHFNRETGGDLVLYVSGDRAANSAAALLSDRGYPTFVSSPRVSGE